MAMTTASSNAISDKIHMSGNDANVMSCIDMNHISGTNGVAYADIHDVIYVTTT